MNQLLVILLWKILGIAEENIWKVVVKNCGKVFYYEIN
jgi:hypothetical protein